VTKQPADILMSDFMYVHLANFHLLFILMHFPAFALQLYMSAPTPSLQCFPGFLLNLMPNLYDAALSELQSKNCFNPEFFTSSLCGGGGGGGLEVKAKLC